MDSRARVSTENTELKASSQEAGLSPGGYQHLNMRFTKTLQKVIRPTVVRADLEIRRSDSFSLPTTLFLSKSPQAHAFHGAVSLFS